MESKKVLLERLDSRHRQQAKDREAKWDRYKNIDKFITIYWVVFTIWVSIFFIMQRGN